MCCFYAAAAGFTSVVLVEQVVGFDCDAAAEELRIHELENKGNPLLFAPLEGSIHFERR